MKAFPRDENLNTPRLYGTAFCFIDFYDTRLSYKYEKTALASDMNRFRILQLLVYLFGWQHLSSFLRFIVVSVTKK